MEMSVRSNKIAVALLATAVIAGTMGEASANRDRYTHRRSGTYYQGDYAGRGYHRGVPGAVVGGALAGAALGLAGAAATGGYYNGYPAYGYGPGYGNAYGYDYHPGHGYYGPY